MIKVYTDHLYGHFQIDFATHEEYVAHWKEKFDGPVKTIQFPLTGEGTFESVMLNVSEDGRLYGLEFLSPEKHLPESWNDPAIIYDPAGDELSYEDILKTGRADLVERFEKLQAKVDKGEYAGVFAEVRFYMQGKPKKKGKVTKTTDV